MRTADSAVVVTLPEKLEMALPGDNLQCRFKLDFPLPINVGMNFALREGGKTVASGLITNLPGDTREDFKEEEARVSKKKTKTVTVGAKG